jgi:hypothetical protein
MVFVGRGSDRSPGATGEGKDDTMIRRARFVLVLGVGLGLGMVHCAAGEDLGQAWDIALRVNAQRVYEKPVWAYNSA